MGKYIQDLIKIFYILYLFASVTNANNLNDIKDKTLSSCVVSIMKEGSTNMSLLDVTLVNMKNDLLVASLHKVEGLRFTSRTFLFDSHRIINSAYVIESENPQELMDGLNHLIRYGQWNPKANYLLILKKINDHGLLNLRNLFLDYNMDNVYFITTKKRGDAIYKLNVSSHNYCRRYNNWTFVSYCSEYRTWNNLPVRRSNESIRNCQFKFIAHNCWPYINFVKKDTDGLEQRILKDFEEYKNIKIKFHTVIKKTDKHGIMVPGFIEDMLKLVQDNKFEGAVGGLFVFNSSVDRLSYTYPVIVDHAIFILARAENLRPLELVIYSSHLSASVCFIFIILCVLTSLLKIFPTHHRDVTRDILLVLGYILNTTGVRNISPNLPQRIVFVSLLMLALLLPYTIHGFIYSSVTKPSQGFEPKHVNELQEYTLILNSEFAYRNTIIENTCDTILNCLLKVKNDKTKSLFTIMSHTFLLSYGSQVTDDQCNKKLYSLGVASFELRAFYLRRGSLMLDHFNKFILRVATAGLIRKYTDDISHSEDLKCQFHERKPMTVNLKYFVIFYIILFIGYMISFIVFLLELILGARKAF